MSQRAEALIRNVDAYVQHLARRSEEHTRETRVTIYAFSSANNIRCLVYDKDVLRLPSMRGLYRPSGMTALIDATMKAIDDLGQTAQLYGDHSFVNIVWTDGAENDSRRARPSDLATRLNSLPENWTSAILVPGPLQKAEVQRYGFPANNIDVWDSTSALGVEEGASRIQEATDRFIELRTQGVRSTRNFFSTGVDAVNTTTVRSTLAPLEDSRYQILPVHITSEIRPFVEANGYHYRTGSAYYQLTKRETIQDHKQVAFLEKATGKVFTGPGSRELIGLPRQGEFRAGPDFNPLYEIYVQSTSVNRKLMPNTKLLLMK